MNIVLVGFMGTGKTAVGKILAKKLNMQYVDIDQLIEEQEKKKIGEIFAEEGEPYFRKVEKELTRKTSKMDNVVIAGGGGVVLDDRNISDLKNKGILICLSAEPEIILERTKKYTHRPLLNVPDPVQEITNLLDKRAEYYAKVDHQIDTSYLSIEQVVERVTAIIEKEKND